jgi:nucleotide-binding universal stress UspA family protein
MGADLIVIGGRCPHAIRQRLFGDITQEIIHDTHCPVLVVPVDQSR